MLSIIIYLIINYYCISYFNFSYIKYETYVKSVIYTSIEIHICTCAINVHKVNIWIVNIQLIKRYCTTVLRIYYIHIRKNKFKIPFAGCPLNANTNTRPPSTNTRVTTALLKNSYQV